jgi:group I intron endonuclease
MIKNIVNNKIYIGQSLDINKRFKRHLRELKNNIHTNDHLQRSWNKYGKNNFKFEIIEQVEENQLNSREVYWIEYYKSHNSEYGYNKTLGGDSEIPTEETKLKLSQASKGKPKSEQHKKNLWKNRNKQVSKETRKKLSEAAKKRVQQGEYFSIEVRKRLSEINKGKKLSEETKRKISETGKANGRKLTFEHKQKLIEACSKPHTEETKRKISESHKGKKMTDEQKKSLWKLSDEIVINILKYLKNGDSINAVSKKTNVSRNVVYSIRDNKTYTHINRNI